LSHGAIAGLSCRQYSGSYAPDGIALEVRAHPRVRASLAKPHSRPRSRHAFPAVSRCGLTVTVMVTSGRGTGFKVSFRAGHRGGFSLAELRQTNDFT
jgi:hypothetical protein